MCDGVVLSAVSNSLPPVLKARIEFEPEFRRTWVGMVADALVTPISAILSSLPESRSGLELLGPLVGSSKTYQAVAFPKLRSKLMVYNGVLVIVPEATDAMN
jgi:hypothetical protein